MAGQRLRVGIKFLCQIREMVRRAAHDEGDRSSERDALGGKLYIFVVGDTLPPGLGEIRKCV